MKPCPALRVALLAVVVGTFVFAVGAPELHAQTVSFDPATNFTAGTNPFSVAIGDLNGDGKPDLAVANQSSNNVTIRLGAGGGAFGAATNFAVGDGPESVAIGDLNGDGKPDLAVANFLSDNVSILLGTGTGSFGAATNFAVGTHAYSVAIADLNGDGKPDLAVANVDSNNVSILLGTGTVPLFAAATNFAVGTQPRSVAIADLNGDGKLDLAVANSVSNNVSILLGTGTGSGTFAAATDFAAGTTPEFVAIGDLNGDGRPDLAVANLASGNVSILLGTGTGSFAAAANFAAGAGPHSVAIGDLNGDGQPDLAVASSNSNNVSILLGTGSGTFGTATNFTVGSFPVSVAIGDLNSDGKPDLAAANFLSDNVSILLNTTTFTPSGTFAPATDFAAGTGPFSVAMGDLNGDGKPDLAVTNGGMGSTNTVSILLGAGAGSFGAATGFAVGTAPFSVAMGDLNGDGKPDLAVANFNSSTVSILLGIGTGSFGAATGLAVGTNPRSVAIGDLNGDGKPDLAVANNGVGVSILLGTGTASLFGAPTSVPVGSLPQSVAIGDFNGDGKPDLAVVTSATLGLTIRLGTGTGTFLAPTGFAVGAGPVAVAIGELNGDGKPDLAVANNGSDNVSILLGTGTVSLFGPATNLTAGTSVRSVAIGDLNRDGKLDLAVPSPQSSNVSILLGTGTGSFGAATNFHVPTNPNSVAIGDVNGDGKPDLAVASAGSGNVSILLNVRPDTAPTATAVSITGMPAVGEILTGEYTYADGENDGEGASTFKWLLDGSMLIGSARTYNVIPDDLGHLITFEVTPVQSTGNLQGTAVSGTSVTIVQGTPTISIGNIPGTAVFGESFTPSYVYTGDGTTSVTSNTPSTCTVSGVTVNYVGVGLCTLAAQATATINYAAATGPDQSFQIGKANATFSITGYSVPYDGAEHTATVTATGALGEDLSSQLTLSGTTHTDAGTYATDAWSFAGAPNYNDASGTVIDTISQATSSVAVACPATPQPHTGSAQTPCTAVYTTSDGLSGPLTVTYSNNINIGTAGANASYAGDTNHAGSSNSGSFAISPAPALVSIRVTPASPSIAKGTVLQFIATGTYSNHSMKDITSNVAWTSSSTTVATINSTGLASGVGTGTSTIKAKIGTISGSTTLCVTAPRLQTIAVTPANPSIPKGARQQFRAMGTYTDGSTKNITSNVRWSSSNLSVATIHNNGRATGAGIGTSTVKAVSGSISGSATLTVTSPVLQSINVTPVNPSISRGAKKQFTATGMYSDGSTNNITSRVSWSSSRTWVATINSSGLATGVGTGTTTIRAAFGGMSRTTTLTVHPRRARRLTQMIK